MAGVDGVMPEVILKLGEPTLVDQVLKCPKVSKVFTVHFHGHFHGHFHDHFHGHFHGQYCGCNVRRKGKSDIPCDNSLVLITIDVTTTEHCERQDWWW
jgi:hypothetical protein